MAATQDERDTIDRQAIRIAYLEKQAALAGALEHDSRMLVQSAHAELLQAQARITELEANAAHLHLEIERRDERIQDLKAQLERIRGSAPARVWQAARRLGR